MLEKQANRFEHYPELRAKSAVAGHSVLMIDGENADADHTELVTRERRLPLQSHRQLRGRPDVLAGVKVDAVERMMDT